VNRLVELLDCSRFAAGNILRVLDALGIVFPLYERRMRRAVVFEGYFAHGREEADLCA